MIIDDIIKIAPPGKFIPKPEAKENFIVKGIGMRRKERAIIYFVPNHNDPTKPYQKGINASELERSYSTLIKDGQFTLEWFKRHLPRCYAEGNCNFTTIGGFFELLKKAKYTKRGIYKNT